MAFKSASTVFLSQAAATIILFLRNILIARLISVEDFGVASTFAIMFAMIETSTNVGLDRMIVQDGQGDDPKFQKVLQAVQVMRGVLAAGIMGLVAYPYANFMGTPDIVWTYQCLALIPVLRGLMHLDMFRYQRDMRFGAFAWTMGASPLASLAVALAVYLVSPNYMTMLWAIMAHQTLLVVLTHVVAERPYRIAWDKKIFLRAMRFGIPMLLNATAIFIILNGDRMIVANQLGLEVLGWFAAAYMLAFTPTMVLGNTLNSVLLPGLSKARDDRPRFDAAALRAAEIGLALAAGVAVGMAIAGPAMLLLFFGVKYADGLMAVILLGAMHGVRMSKMGAATVAVSQGRTKLPLYANLTRLLALPIGYYALSQGGGVVTLILIATAGEAVGLLVLFGLMGRVLQVPLRSLVVPVVAFFALIGAVLWDTYTSPLGTDILGNLHWSHVALVGGYGLFLALLPNLRGLALGKLRSRAA